MAQSRYREHQFLRSSTEYSRTPYISPTPTMEQVHGSAWGRFLDASTVPRRAPIRESDQRSALHPGIVSPRRTPVCTEDSVGPILWVLILCSRMNPIDHYILYVQYTLVATSLTPGSPGLADVVLATSKARKSKQRARIPRITGARTSNREWASAE